MGMTWGRLMLRGCIEATCLSIVLLTGCQKAKEQAAERSGAVLAPAKASAAEAAATELPELSVPSDAERRPSGLATLVLEAGSGSEHPDPWDMVSVQMTGRTMDGRVFVETARQGHPDGIAPELRPSSINAGFSEGLSLMVVGEKRRIWVPEELSYKAQPRAPKGAVVYDVELLDVARMPAPPVAPTDVAAPPADAERTTSGLLFKVLREGNGKVRPSLSDAVVVNFTGWTTDGVPFGSSITSGKPATLALPKVVKGWAEGVSLMTVGEKRRLWVPESLAYAGAPGKPKGMLVFDVELLEIATPRVPSDLKKPGKTAERLASGVASRVLKKGTGSVHPRPDSTVLVHFSGWQENGSLIDSTIMNGQPEQFRLDQVLPGWSEVLVRMVEGESRRIWIPKSLGSSDMSGAPAGDLVFDMELLEIAPH